MAKQARGDKLSRDELRDAQWLQARNRETELRELLAAVPKGLYCQLAGRQQKVVDEQARRYQLPLTGSEVDLFSAIKAVHDFLARNAELLGSGGEEDLVTERMRGQVEHLRTKKKLLDLEIEQRQNTLVGRDELGEVLVWWEQQLRAFGELLGRKYGREAQQLTNDFLRRAADELTGPDRLEKPRPRGRKR